MTKKLNETEYKIDINGLTTSSAATLSHMLKIADEAENGLPPPEDSITTVVPSDTEEVSFEPDTYTPDITDAEQLDVIDMRDVHPDNVEESAVSEDLVLNPAEKDPTVVAKQEDGLDSEGDNMDLAKDVLRKQVFELGGCENLSSVEIHSLATDIANTFDVDVDELIAGSVECYESLSPLEISRKKHDFENDLINNQEDMKFDIDLDMIEEDAVVDKPVAVGSKTAFYNKKEKLTDTEAGENCRPKYTSPITGKVMGKEATKGFEKPAEIEDLIIKLECALNKDKIKLICECAKKSYGKNKKEMYESIDNRYIKKLMEAGCSSEAAIKVLETIKK